MALQDYNHSVDKILQGDKIELNPILGKNPSRSDFAAFGLAGVTATFLCEKYLPDSWFKTTLLYSIIETERYNIEENERTEYGSRQHNAIIIKTMFVF
jgi:hypothetical protein